MPGNAGGQPIPSKEENNTRSKMWETVAEHLSLIDQPKFKVAVHSVRDRYLLISRKYRKRMEEEKRASGIAPEQSELDVLLEELIELEDSSEEQRQSEGQENSKKIERDRAMAMDMRLKAMEKLSETQKRKAQDANDEPKKKSRKSGSDTIAYLREKHEQEMELRRQELDLKKQQHEEERKKQDENSKRQEDMMRLMAQQNKMMMDLIGKLVGK